jgi:hypothetical protein
MDERENKTSFAPDIIFWMAAIVLKTIPTLRFRSRKSAVSQGFCDA